MEPYLLRENDLELLRRSNAIKNTMAVAGDAATPEELEVLFPAGNMPAQQNRNVVMNENATILNKPMPNPNSLEVRNVVPRVEPPELLPTMTDMGLLTTPISNDPFDSLSKTQRRKFLLTLFKKLFQIISRWILQLYNPRPEKDILFRQDN